MAAHDLAHDLRRDAALDRLYESHAARVYRFALAMVAEPEAAERITRETFEAAWATLERGARPARAGTWLIRIAHARCRKHSGYEEGVAEELARSDGDGWVACPAFESLIARELDGPLADRERSFLHGHLRLCEPCRSTAIGQREQQAAIRALRAVALPASLAR